MDDQVIKIRVADGRILLRAIVYDISIQLIMDAEDALQLAGTLMECADEVIEKAEL